MSRHGVPVETAVVTGGGSGLGKALAEELAGRGVAVAVADLDGGRAEEVARSLGGRSFAFEVDVRDPDAVQALRDAALDRLGAVDLWVNNAGVAAAGPVGEVPLDDWRWVLDVNLMGVVHGCHVIAPYLRQRGRGAILNVASAAGLISTPDMGPYNASKAAVVSLSETLYGELKPHGVGVTVLCPTFFQTNLLDTARSPDPKHMKIAGSLMRRARSQAQDVARAGLADVAAGRLYSVPMADGRFLWRLRRLVPQTFYDLMPRAVKVVRRG